MSSGSGIAGTNILVWKDFSGDRKYCKVDLNFVPWPKSNETDKLDPVHHWKRVYKNISIKYTKQRHFG